MALFQILNAVQVLLMSALRGLKDTQVPFYINIGCYWILGIPLCFYFSKMGASGVWLGMILVQCVLVISLVYRWILKKNNDNDNVSVS